MKRTYFLSYKREDFKDIKTIASILLLHGISVWQDLNNLKTGLSETQIRKAICKECSGLIFLSTRKSVQSPVILKIELPEAEQKHKKNSSFHIIPVFRLGIRETDAALKGHLTIPISNFNGVKIGKGCNEDALLCAALEVADLVLRSLKFNKKYPLLMSLSSKQKVNKDVYLAIDFTPFFLNGLPAQKIWNEYFKRALSNLKNCLIAKKITHLRLFSFAHLSLALLFGYIFRETSGFILEIEQRGRKWSTATKRGKNPLKFATFPGNLNSKNLCVRINLVAKDDNSLLNYIRKSKLSYRALLEFLPSTFPFTVSANDAYAIAKDISIQIKQAHAKFGTNKVHIFAAVPLGLALFIGHCLNACGKIQCYEFNNITRQYSPSCCLD